MIIFSSSVLMLVLHHKQFSCLFSVSGAAVFPADEFEFVFVETTKIQGTV